MKVRISRTAFTWLPEVFLYCGFDRVDPLDWRSAIALRWLGVWLCLIVPGVWCDGKGRFMWPRFAKRYRPTEMG